MNDELTPYRLYVLFNVMKLHFSTEKYDIRRYGTNSKKFSYDRFERDRFKAVYHALAKRLETEKKGTMVIASNLVRDASIVPVNLDDELASNLKRYNANKIALLDDIKYEISSGLFTKIKNGDIINSMVSGELSIEIMAFLSRLLPIKELIDSSGVNKFMWDMLRRKIYKYEPFCLFETTEQRDSIKESILHYIETNRGNRQ